ncbi:hypothetical protein I2494_12185 [Budviciaceae bacterium BWR-B9]|uniref:Resolvase/invertase-type recombinase catalytic domain-containing protein n=1 Tax=Limnobaculum allomyrinae TaxID=2791986 RepID=A0ABS1IRS4_9GAMM|nr:MULTISPECIES: hypothetical protein [Limnobaculum]MBK5144468.1 hypothetical protein [Limnobaculum allomyrinae]MBV7692305.1 hypothetical protein [Limnobaculum sp. M2-1]
MSIIYGYIKSSALDDERLDLFNKAVLQELPYCGAYICRDMFSVLPYGNRATSKYSHLIHFAAEYNNIYVMPDEWLEEFECLLAKLCWNRACVIETYSGNRFEWSAIYKDKIIPEKIEATQEWNRAAYDSYHYLNEI